MVKNFANLFVFGLLTLLSSCETPHKYHPERFTRVIMEPEYMDAHITAGRRKGDEFSALEKYVDSRRFYLKEKKLPEPADDKQLVDKTRNFEKQLNHQREESLNDEFRTIESQDEITDLKKKDKLNLLFLFLALCITATAIIISFLKWRYWKRTAKSVLQLTDLNNQINSQNNLLERSIKLLDMSQNLSKTGGWEYNLKTKDVFLTRQAYSLYDLDLYFTPTWGTLRALFNDEEKRVLTAIALSTIKRKEQLQIETEIFTESKERKWVRIIAEPLLEDNAVVGSIGAIQDITLEKQAEKMQEDLTEHLQTLITSLEDIILEVDGCKVFKNVWVSDDQQLFMPKSKILGKSIMEVFGPMADLFAKPIEKVLETETTVEIEYKHQDPSVNKWYKAKTTLINKNDDPAHCRIIVSVQDITARKLQDMALKEAKDKLEESNQHKDRIMQVLVHDLRSPLSGIHSVSSAMLKKNNYTVSDREMLSAINDTSLFLFKMVNDLVGINLNNENRMLKKEETDLLLLAQQTIQILQFKANEKRQTIELLMDEQVFALIDSQKIQQVLNNLINNAIKFSSSGSVVTVTAKHEGAIMRMSVSDRGIGVPHELKHKVFDVFTEAKRYGTNNEQPLGLGLSICKQIIEAHGGKIWLQSEMGQGTTFFIEIPDAVVRVASR